MPPVLRRALRLPYLVVLALLVAIGAVTATTWSAGTTNAAAAAACTTNPLGAATGWTEFVRGNGRRGSSESEGKVAYGGDLDAGWMTIAMGQGSQGIPGTEPTLVVGGAGGSFNVNRGSAYVRDLRGGLNLNGGTGAKRLAGSPLDVAAAFPDLTARSAAWARVPATGTAQIRLVDGFKRFLDLTGADPDLNVFSVAPEQLVNLEGIHLRTPATSTALINVTGAGTVPIDGEVDYLTSGSSVVQASDGTHERNVRTLWNFADATGVTLRIRGAFGGTIVAPNAEVTVTDNVGHNLGQVVAKGFASQRETHLNLFAGCLPAVGADGGTPTAPTTPTTTVPPTTTTAPTTTVPPTTTTAPTTTVPPTTTTSPTTTVPPTTTTTPTVPTTPTTPQEPTAASLRVTKTVDHALVTPGSAVAFTITARNAGDAPAENVVVSDLVPVGITDPRGEGCTVDGQVVRCEAGTLAPGATRSFVVRGTAGLLTGGTEREDQIVPFDAQTDWTLEPGQQRTATLSCGPSALLADGSVRIVDVDHSGAADRSVVHVLRERIDGGAYEATIVNRGAGRAQGRLHAACLPLRTTTGRDVLAGDPITKTAVLDARPQPYDVVFDCGTGRVPVGASVDVPPGRARIVSSVPDGTTRRVIGLRVDQDATEVTVGVRCVSTLTAPKDGVSTQLSWRVVQRDVALQPGQQVADLGLECGAQEKGVVAGWKLDYGLLPVGDEPQIKTRKFAIDNPTDRVLGGTLYLLCLGDRLTDAGAAADLVNTASATTTTPQDAAAVLSASAGLRVQQAPADPAPSGPSISLGGAPAVAPAPAAAPQTVARAAASRTATLRSTRVAVSVACAAGCSGTVEVRAQRAVRVGGRTLKAKALLAKARFRVTGARGTVQVRLPAKTAAALRRQGARKLRVVVRDAAGRRTTTVVTLKRR